MRATPWPRAANRGRSLLTQGNQPSRTRNGAWPHAHPRSPFVPAEAGPDLETSECIDARERACGPGPRFRGDERSVCFRALAKRSHREKLANDFCALRTILPDITRAAGAQPRSELGPKTPQGSACDRALPSRARALVPPRPQLDRAVRYRHPEGRSDRALNQPDLAAMRAHQLGRDREAKAGAARAVR